MFRIFRKTQLSVFFIMLIAVAGSVQADAPRYTAPGRLLSVPPMSQMPKVGQALTGMYQGYLAGA
ncbi:MAG: hypothetical protein J4N94_03770, partial [Chloroflexi bacterium]|nr:hypothetical protein [Chloroflexota bacterium]